jgi:ABC-2 type transport system ATP-binding protein
VAEGTADELKSSVGTASLQLRLADADADALATAASLVERVLGTPAVVSPEGARLTAPMTAPDRVTDLLVSFRDAGVSLAEMSVQKPTLDEVFLTITGSPTSADADTDTESERALEGSPA